MKPLADKDIQAGLQKLAEWSECGDAIQRTFAFADFLASMRFVNQVAEAAEARQHHQLGPRQYRRPVRRVARRDHAVLFAPDQQQRLRQRGQQRARVLQHVLRHARQDRAPHARRAHRRRSEVQSRAASAGEVPAHTRPPWRRAARTPMNDPKAISTWLDEQQITEIECLTPDMSGQARGKIVPRHKYDPAVGLRLLKNLRE